MPNVVRYDQDPATGAFTFHRDDGASQMFADSEEARGLASWVDQRQGPDRRLASNFQLGAPVNVRSDVGAPLYTNPPPVNRREQRDELMAANFEAGGNVGYLGAGGGPAVGANQNAGVSVDGGMRPAGVTMPNEPPPMLAAQAPQMQPEAGPAPRQVTPGEALATGLMARGAYTPGRAAVNQQVADARVAMPTAMTQQGILPETPEEKEQREKDMGQLRKVNEAAAAHADAAAEETIASAEERRADAVERAFQARLRVDDEQDKRRMIDEAWNSKRAQLQGEIDAVTNQKVDPQRLFSGAAGAVNGIIGALSVGLGAFGATLSGGPNYAEQAIDAAIQRDIDAQEDQIHRLGAKANNAMADMMRQYDLSVEESREAVKQAQLQFAQATADKLAATGPEQARLQADQFKSGLLEKQLASQAALAETYKGRQSRQYAMVDPQRAIAGGRRQLTAKEIIEAAKAGQEYNRALGIEGADTSPEAINSKLKRQTDVLERRVTLDNGGFAWATSKERADKAQGQIDATAQYKKNVTRQREILNKTGDSIDPEMRDEYNTLAAANTALQKQIEDLGAITSADQELVAPLTGVGGQDLARFKAGVLAASKVAEQHADFRFRSAQKQLFSEPEAQNLVQKTEAGLGIKETRK